MSSRGRFRFERLTTMVRLLLLGCLGLALVVLVALGAQNEEGVMDFMVLSLLGVSPLLVWFTVEPEPPRDRTLGSLRRLPLWVRFPFLPGGPSGVVFLLLTFADYSYR